MAVRIIQGDCRDVLKTLPDNSVHSIVTDPPYGLGFMGKAWDHAVPGIEFWGGMLRVAKPGAFLVAFGGTRTFHRMACAIEDAGWELRDTLMWVYGSGFPKSKNLDGDRKGWGTALKPAWEPIIMARKPLIGTVAANVELHGCGALNIDGCRIETEESLAGGAYADSAARSVSPSLSPTGMNRTGAKAAGEFIQPIGRWPANVVHDGSDEVLAAFPDALGQQGDLKETGRDRPSSGRFGDMGPPREHLARDKTAGATNMAMQAGRRREATSAARFFYCAKASREDRNVGCDDLEAKPLNWSSGTQSPGTFQAEGTNRSAKNNHPTVKPTELMRWLVRLVTPPGGTVLDPFAGSGSTGRAADIEQFDAILIEIDPAYAAIARKRINGDSPLFSTVSHEGATPWSSTAATTADIPKTSRCRSLSATRGLD